MRGGGIRWRFTRIGGQERGFFNQPRLPPTGRIAGRSNAFNQNLSVEGLICNLWAPEIARGMYLLVSSLQ